MTQKDISLKPTTPSEVAKAIVYIALAALGILVTALGDNHLSLVEILQVCIVIAGAIPVYLIAGTIPKTISAFVVAGLQASVLLIIEAASIADIGVASWLGVIIAAFAAIGVAVVPNSGKPGPLAVVPVSSASVARDMQHVIDAEKVDQGESDPALL